MLISYLKAISFASTVWKVCASNRVISKLPFELGIRPICSWQSSEHENKWGHFCSCHNSFKGDKRSFWLNLNFRPSRCSAKRYKITNFLRCFYSHIVSSPPWTGHPMNPGIRGAFLVPDRSLGCPIPDHWWAKYGTEAVFLEAVTISDHNFKTMLIHFRILSLQVLSVTSYFWLYIEAKTNKFQLSTILVLNRKYANVVM